MAFLVATTSLPAVYRPNGYARTTTAATPHARAKREHLAKEDSSDNEQMFSTALALVQVLLVMMVPVVT